MTKTQNEIISALISAHEATATVYRRAADEACAKGDTYEVYRCVRAHMAEETKARQLRQRFGV